MITIHVNAFSPSEVLRLGIAVNARQYLSFAAMRPELLS